MNDDKLPCTNPILWAVFYDTAVTQSFGWDSNERYFFMMNNVGATFHYDLKMDVITGFICGNSQSKCT